MRPKLWWSPTVGLISVSEDHEGETIFWKIHHNQESLRHMGLPNDLPKDAVELVEKR